MRRFALIVAAALLVAGLVWLKPFHAKSPQIAVGDTAALKPDGPSGTILGPPTFRWQSSLTNVRYRVTVRRGPTVVWVGTVDAADAVAPNSTAFEPGAEYSWQVDAIDQQGNVQMSSPPQTFVIS
jgi:hypothetical protein